MIRDARMIDILRLVELLEYAQARSVYAGRVAVDVPYAKKYLGGAIMRNGNIHHGGTCVKVVEDADGEVQGFILGALDRVYGIGDKLAAFDNYLVVTDEAPPLSAKRLFDSYVAWASACPSVVEIGASHTQALPESERLASVFERAGFRPYGTIYQRANEPAEERMAA